MKRRTQLDQYCLWDSERNELGDNTPKYLYLPVEGGPYKTMCSYEKKTEYRRATSRLTRQLRNHKYNSIHVVNGYGEHRPSFKAELLRWEIVGLHSPLHITYPSKSTIHITTPHYAFYYNKPYDIQHANKLSTSPDKPWTYDK